LAQPLKNADEATAAKLKLKRLLDIKVFMVRTFKKKEEKLPSQCSAAKNACTRKNAQKGVSF